MIKALKLMFIVIMMVGITLTILNFISVDNRATQGGFPEDPAFGTIGTLQSDGLCMGEALNC